MQAFRCLLPGRHWTTETLTTAATEFPLSQAGSLHIAPPMGIEAHEEAALLAVPEAGVMKPLWPTSWDNPLGPAQDTHAQHKHGQDEHAHRPAWLVPRPRPVGSKTCGKLRMQTRSNLTHPLCLAPYEENQHEATTLPMNSASYAACCTLATPRCQLGAA